MVAGSAAVAILFGAVSLLYAMAGQAGGTAFIAVMAIAGFPADEMRPTALLLNIVAAGLATWWLPRQRAVDWQGLGPILIASLPSAFVGGLIVLGDRIYLTLTGVILILASLALFARKWASHEVKDRPIPLASAALVGTGVGLLAGLTGVGGGVFLAPVLMLGGWASPQRVAQLCAPFILANSLPAFAGTLIAGQSVASDIWLYAAAALIGAAIGGWVRLRWMSGAAIRIALAAVLLIAGGRLILV
jgi:uncharacterized membrane protein YfcA